jgi:hypothetical protein
MEMICNLRRAEDEVVRLLKRANRSHHDARWTYELTSEVDNIEVVSTPGVHILRIHPCWLRYVVAQGDFQACVADEVEGWYLLERLTAGVRTPA